MAMKKTVFAITGGSGAGKSEVSKMFRDNGVNVIDADLVSREVCKSGTDCLHELLEAFGDEIINADGTLNRKKLAEIVFSNTEKLKLLNKITHHYIKLKVEEIIGKTDSSLIAIDGAVIIGSNVEKLCEFIVVVDADPDIRKERIINRDNISEALVQKRLNSQPDSEFYKQHADYIITNNGDYDNLKESVIKICNEIKRRKVIE